MAIDQYEHDFDHLARTDLRQYMADLRQEMSNPYPMSTFAVPGVGVATLCRDLGLEADFSGCYVLIEKAEPIYVGISRSVLQRLRQHLRGKTHYNASLAYRIATRHMPQKLTRTKAMETEAFRAQFEKAREYLESLNVAWVRISNPLALYVFEPYCAMELDTSEWNTFETS